MANLDTIYKSLEDKLLLDKTLYRNIYTKISTLVNNIFMDSIKSEEGYCYRFKLPVTEINKLYNMLELDQKTVFNAFEQSWGKAAMTNRMHSDPYYLILLLLLYYGLKQKDENLANSCLVLILCKIWNGRKARYLKYCDPKVMNYVRDVMMNNRFVIKKYDHPFLLLRDYFVPSLMQKYAAQIVKVSPGHSIGLKRLFEQGYSRIRQVFAFDFKTNVNSGERIAGSGILPLYKKAKEEGLYLGAIKSQEGESGNTNFDDFGNVHVRDKIINDVVNYIVMNVNPSYPDNFIRLISKVYKTNVSVNAIQALLNKLHNYKYQDDLKDIILLILSRTGITDKNQICSTDFALAFRRKIISSKNNKDVNRIYELARKIADDILQQYNGKRLDDFSAPHKLQIVNVILYGIYYNLRRKVCQTQ